MAKKKGGKTAHTFRNKLLLNQWLISLFGIDPLHEHHIEGKQVLPYQLLSQHLKDIRTEGLGPDGLHIFYHNLVSQVLALFPNAALTKDVLLRYEENIVRHTEAINAQRTRPITWKYYQWLTLLFTEVYLDRYFNQRERLLEDLNAFVVRFNQKYPEHQEMKPYTADDLNKVCYQNATGSGKTLVMHVNLLQFRHYAREAGQANDLSRVILLTPNESLSRQHIADFENSSINAAWFAEGRNTLFTAQTDGLRRVDVMEITKLAEKDGPTQIATRSLGDQNLLLVDEGHRGLKSTEEGTWVKNRNSLCAKGFTFEYSATFEQAVNGTPVEDDYAKCVLFDYSYRWFYEDGFGKDYRIANISRAQDEELKKLYMTGALLRAFQQHLIYEEQKHTLRDFNIEKPLWVFVGHSVSGGKKWSEDESVMATDVAKILVFLADFLHHERDAQRRIEQLITATGQETGLIGEDDEDIFRGSFHYLEKKMAGGTKAAALYRDILRLLFNNASGGTLRLERLKGDKGEVALHCGTSEVPFGLIYVGSAKELCDHIEELATRNSEPITVGASDFGDGLFEQVKESSSPVNLLIGSKKFIEGWDCWRVSSLGLMHVARSEGTQVIQLFGRGVRLKGHGWSLKRSGHLPDVVRPEYIHELETLNVFGIDADFMAHFRDWLRQEGLPGNERVTTVRIPMNVTYDVGKRLKVLRPRMKMGETREVSFSKDGPVMRVGDIPDKLRLNRVESDWYPRIDSESSQRGAGTVDRKEGRLESIHLAWLDWDALYLDLERYKRDKRWHNVNITREGLRSVLADSSWYRLLISPARLTASDMGSVRLWQQVALELLKRYLERVYNYRQDEYYLPRLVYRELGHDDENLPAEGSDYSLVIDSSEAMVIQEIEQLKNEIEENKDDLVRPDQLKTVRFPNHLFQPLFHAKKNGKIKIMPVALNESEYTFVDHLCTYCTAKKEDFAAKGMELFLLRNQSRGKGIGFFEAGNFYPDFILWILHGGKQYVTFIEPHGLLHGSGPQDPKIQFHQRIKEIEERCRQQDPNIVLNSFVLSWTPFAQLHWGWSKEVMKENHVYLMQEAPFDGYVGEMVVAILSIRTQDAIAAR
jgi:superfamily II DNA or RNA helicase